LHAWHCPAQLVLQHTPSVQLPDAHSSAVAHGFPFARFGLQTPFSQRFGVWQSSSAAQGNAHAPFLHR
jgi:hypothetical protein